MGGGILNFPQFKSFSLNQNTFCKILAFTTRIHNLAAFLNRGQRHGFAHFGKMEIPMFVFVQFAQKVGCQILARTSQNILPKHSVLGIFVSVGNNIKHIASGGSLSTFISVMKCHQITLEISLDKVVGNEIESLWFPWAP